MRGYKGFDKNMKCRGFQYEFEKTYETDSVEICSKGFHFCENPLDVLDYYTILDSDAKNQTFAEILAEKDITPKDNKRACSKITIGAKLDIKGLIKASVDFMFETNKAVKVKDFSKLSSSGASSKLAASGDNSQLAASGAYSQLAASGTYSLLASSGTSSKLAASGASSKLAASGTFSQLAASGTYSQLASSGTYSQLAASGDSSQLAASGDNSQLAASGDSSQLAASGDNSQLASSGTYSQLAASGDNSQLAASGTYSVVAGIGIDNTAMAVKGCWIVLAEWVIENNKRIPKRVKSAKVDGKKIKENTYYKLDGGKFKEVKA